MVGGACWWGLVYKKCSGGRGPAGGALFTRSVVVGAGAAGDLLSLHGD